MIEFYGYKSPFSNFFPCMYAFEWQGQVYMVNCSEQAYMICKATIMAPSRIHEIMTCKYGKQAKDAGRKLPYNKAWEDVKVEAMYQAVSQKFTKVPGLAELLKSTGDEVLVEASPTDSFWGAGTNMLGQILMKIRSQL